MTDRDRSTRSKADEQTFEYLRKNLKLVERGGTVKRYHTVLTIKEETVAAHSFQVAWLIKLFSEEMPSVNVVYAALQHDNAEYVTGDLPGPTKNELKISHQFEAYERQVISEHLEIDFSSKLTKEEARLLHVADLGAGLLYCVQERAMGNRFIEEAFGNYRRGFEEATRNGRTKREAMFMEIIDARWKYATE